MVLTSQMWLCLAIFLFMIVGYVVGPKYGITNGVTAMVTITLVTWSGLIPVKNVLSNFATKNALQIIGMFIIAAGFNRTQAVKKLSAKVYEVSGGSFRKVLTGYVLMGVAMTNLGISPMTTFAIIGPLAGACCADFNISPTKMIMPIAMGAIGGGGSLPIGRGAIQYATLNGYLESYGYPDYQMQLLDPFKAKLPISIIIVLVSIFIIPKFCPDQPSVPITLDTIKNKGKKGEKEVPPLSPFKEACGYGIFIGATLALILQSKFEFGEPWQIAYSGACLVVLTGVLTPKEAINSLPMRPIMMLAAAQNVGACLTACGLGELIGDTLAASMGGTHNGYIIGAAFFIIPFILTQLMNNASVLNIFRPIAILTCKSLACNSIGPLLLLQNAAATAFLTPMATGTIPIVMDIGGYDQKDLLKMGWLPSLIMCVTSVLWIMTIFPAY